MPLTSDTLKGLWAGMPVPWTAQDQVDEEALRENVRRMCRAGAHGVYSHGTTGEFYAQTPEEWRQVARVTVEECRPFGTPTQVGCTALWTAEAVRRVRFAQEIGAGGVQVAFPFWLAVSDAEAARFLKEVTRQAPGMPLILYNTGRSKKPLTPDLLKRLLDQDLPLIGCKGVASQEEAAAFLDLAPGLRIFVGEDLLADWWHAGVRGSYSSLVYACPKLMLRYFELCEEGHPEAVEIGKGLQRLFREFVIPLVQEGFTDTAFDRTFAAATGILTGELLASRPPYRAATRNDVDRFLQICLRVFPRFLEESRVAAPAGRGGLVLPETNLVPRPPQTVEPIEHKRLGGIFPETQFVSPSNDPPRRRGRGRRLPETTEKKSYPRRTTKGHEGAEVSRDGVARSRKHER